MANLCCRDDGKHKNQNIMLSVHSDEHFMKLALQEAQDAFVRNEIPVGAIITIKNRVIAKSSNQVEKLNDVTAHAEMIAITSAQNYLGSKYLNDCKLYVTLEPCVMCAGALYWSQIGEVVIGARDQNRGFSRIEEQIIHPKTQLKWEVMEAECADLITTFFQKLRRNNS